jgi:hypothetical protein
MMPNFKISRSVPYWRTAAFISTIFALLALAGCGGIIGGQGYPAPAPTNVKAVAGDGIVTVSWDMSPNVQYWLFHAAANSITPHSCISLPACATVIDASSPAVITGLANGTTYSFTIDGRVNNGPAGPGSSSVSAVPRPAGTTWSVGSQIGTNDLHGISYGTAPVTVSGITGNAFVAVGSNEALYFSPDGKNWSPATTAPITTPAANANLNASIAYGSTYVAVGANGVVLYSSNATTWTQAAAATANELFGVASNGAGGFVAVGANGSIITSSGGLTWAAATSPTTNNLYAITYANGRYVAVGAAGTLLTSTDGINWQSFTPQTTNDLKGVAYGSTAFVAVGAAGTLVVSTDGGTTWALQPTPISTLNINAATYSSQFIAVGDAGGVFTSSDGVNWQPQSSGTSMPLFAVTHGLYGYSAAGSAGTNLTAN